MDDARTRPRPRGDEAQLFRDFNDELMRTVARSTVASSPQTIEDACAFAWTKFIEQQPDRGRNWQGWLFRTAQREVWALERQHAADWTVRATDIPLAGDDVTDLRDEVEDALSVLRQLPERLQRIVLLRALGFQYREIGEITGDSQARVHVLVKRANSRVFSILEARDARLPQASTRAARLRVLEESPPDWLVDRIGALPQPRFDSSDTVKRRAWRRAALALDDYRTAVGTDEFPPLPSTPPADPTVRAVLQRALRAVTELHQSREPGHGLQR